ncbi:flagellar motor protein MotB [Gilvibacter sp. SZ-19]|jgi:outer membrane protein OmpA-like peptidoglycan-associated protein/Tol biopolymer transport system component|uniref:OmpA family protein n=1 Tax=unclassified Gilvibacter TaxID=2625242 RepID=UPI000B3D29B1|nr:OmpA family protein [Gilvibacter sp. SZ-19]ARV11184.1 flagellar motor protein MotB [Gilvibacter sp. SZ-19]
MNSTSPIRSAFIALGFLLSLQLGHAQTTQLNQANKEYDKYAYIDAQKVYLQVVKDGYVSAEIYQKLGNTYFFNSDYKDAAKWYGRLVSDYAEEAEPIYYYRYALALKSLGRYEESDQMMATFVEKGGATKIATNFKANPDYLKDIAFGAIDYELSKVSANTANSDFGPAYFGENKVVFASASDTIMDGKLAVHEWNNQPYLDLFIADMDAEGDLINLKRLKGDVNTKYHESNPAFTQDLRHMYFTRNNFIDGKRGKDKTKTIRLKIYKATLSGETFWTNIQELPFNSDDYSVAHPTLSLDGKRLYFASDMPGTLGQSDIWYVTINEDGTYGDPVNVTEINTEARESFPFISESNHLYFSSDGRAGLGGLDIYMTPLNENGLPTTITNLGEPANSEKDDFGFIVRESKKIGYLSSNRDGDAGFTNDEIYRVRQCEITLEGVITDAGTGELLPGARVQLVDAENNPVGEPVIVGDDAKYSFVVACNTQYVVRADKLDYEPAERIVNTPDVTSVVDASLALIGVPCASNDLGCKLDLQPIYFDLDRFNIRPDAAVELAKILVAMQQYPELVIHIESHTDSRATDRYNEILSERRAQSTMAWLVERGIAPSRLSAKGYGETRLVNQCANGVECSEEEHQLNRRSMFIIQD